MPVSLKEKVARLRSMLAQVAPDSSLESLPLPQRRKRGRGEAATEETISIEGAAAAAGLKKIVEGRDEDVNLQEMATLEAIVMPQNRPVVFVENGTYADIPSPWEHLNTPAARSIIDSVLPSVGRIELPHTPWIPYGGTGFIVGPDLLMTNRHVAKLFAEGLGTQLTYRPGDAAVDLKREKSSPDDDRSAFFDVKGVLMIHPYWDMALLKVDGLSARFPSLKLSVLEPDGLVGREIVAIGYPARDDRNDLDLQDRIFEKQYRVKRLQPGKLRARAEVRSFESLVKALTHDSSTLGGNSGSAIVDVATGHVLGLHFAGEYLKANYAVPSYELARDGRVVDAGVSFDGTVAATDEWRQAWQRAGSPEQPVVTVPASPAVREPAPVDAAATTVTWRLPLTVTVSLGAPLRDGQPALSKAVVPALTEGMKVPIILAGLEHREGYKDGFLELASGARVPVPVLTAIGKSVVAKLEDGSFELKYHKFSVVVHKGRRLALFTASNVDWRSSQRMPGGQKPNRKQLTGLNDGDIEKWVTDWRIPPQQQLPDVFFTKDGGAFDKGHLVRRDDVCWGPSFADIQKSNGDTYHTTNCTPQTGPFNQSARGEDNWGDLENLIQKETKAEKAIIFAGPVLADDDRLFDGRDESGSVVVRIPRRFWKIVVVKGGQSARAYGFMLEQDMSNVPLREEFVVPATWKRYMASIADIEDLLFGAAKLDWLKERDQFDANEGVRLRKELS